MKPKPEPEPGILASAVLDVAKAIREQGTSKQDVQILADLLANSERITVKLEGVAKALRALDRLTPKRKRKH